jgi:hypothetical protein
MMLAWSFAARTADEVGALLRALGKHRYVKEVELRLHFSIDRALAFDPHFRPHADAFQMLLRSDKELDPSSRDPRLWRQADVEDVVRSLSAFWEPGREGERAKKGLIAALEDAGIELPAHAPFASDPEEPPHPELIELNWVLWSVDSLDAERHEGALRAMEIAGEEVDVSALVYQEGPCLSAPELLGGAVNGVLREDWTIWSDGPYSYADYVFRGAARAAKLVEPPVGARDDDSA